MKPNQIVELIAIRNYVAMSMDNYKFTKDKVNQLNNVLIMLDKKISDEIIGEKFKATLGMEDLEDTIKEIKNLNDIKRDMKPSNKFITIEDGKVEVK